MADFAPHNLTSRIGSGVFIVIAPSGVDNPERAFDGSTGVDNKCSTWGSALALTVFIGGKRVLSGYSIKIPDESLTDRAPKAWTVSGSNDGSSWTTVDTVTNQTGWSQNEKRDFTCDTATTAYRYFKLDITENNGGAVTAIGEVYLDGGDAQETIASLSPHDLTSDTSHSPYVVSASTESANAFYAFDASQSTKWLGTNSGTDWLKIDLGSGNSAIVYCYAVQICSEGNNNRGAKNWTLEGSSDDSNWNTVDTVTNQTGWFASQVRMFDCDSATTPYRYYRLNVTANNSDTYTDIGGMGLYSLSTPTTVSPSYGSLTVTGYAPSVSVSVEGATVEPGIGELALTGYAPSVTATDNKSVSPAIAELAATGYAPSLAVTDHKVISPALGELSITGIAPTIAATDHKSLTPGYGELSITGYAPSVGVGSNIEVTPDAGTITLTGYAPGVSATDNKYVSPGLGELSITGYAPSVANTANVSVSPATGVLTLTGYAPSVIGVNFDLSPAIGVLTLVGFAPSVSVGAVVPRIFGDSPTGGAVRLFGTAPSGTPRVFDDAPTGGAGRIFQK